MYSTLSPLVAASCVSRQSICQDTGFPLGAVILISAVLVLLVIVFNHMRHDWPM